MLIYASLATEGRNHVLDIISMIELAMMNPMEFIKKGYWTFDAGKEILEKYKNLENDNPALCKFMHEALDTILSHYGWEITEHTTEKGKDVEYHIIPAKKPKPNA